MTQEANKPPSEDERPLRYREVLLGVGRNTLAYQQCEHLLKFIVPRLRWERNSKQIAERRHDFENQYPKGTLGQLVGDFVERYYGPEPDETTEPTVVAAPNISFRLRAGMEFDLVGAELYKKRRSELSKLVEERNWLVHHFVSEWKPENTQSSIEMIERLDVQHKRAAAEFQNLKTVVDDFGRASKMLGSQASLQVSEFFWLRTSVLVDLLGEFALANADADGWADLASAANHCRQKEPKHMAQLKNIYGYARLKKAMLATQLFEFSVAGRWGISAAKYRVNDQWAGRDQMSVLIPPP